MENAFLFRGFKKALIQRYGAETGARLWRDAEAEYARLKSAYPSFRGDGKNMLPVGAIYLALRAHDAENALPFLLDCGRETGVRLGGIIHALTSIPGLPELLWKHMPALMDKASGDEKGYARRLVSGENMIGVDIVSCPIFEAAKTMGIPEAATIVCAMDKAYMSGFRRIDYTRSLSLAEGDECCDYRLSYNRAKP